MAPVLLILYGVYLVMVGVRGNAMPLITALGQEKTFLYWIVVIAILGLIWQSDAGGGLAKGMVILIVVGFLLVQGNAGKIGAGFKQVLPGA